MRSDVIIIEKGKDNISLILEEVEKVAAYNNIDGKKTMHLRLLAEELVNMLPELANHYRGEFYAEGNDNKFELHAKLKTISMTLERREALIAVSKSGKNAAAVGITGKIRSAVEVFALASGSEGILYLDQSSGMMNGTAYEWALSKYKEKKDADKEKWDELEKSIVANIADDVLVSVKGNNVEIVIKKEFN